jgi:hypothetical protein
MTKDDRRFLADQSRILRGWEQYGDKFPLDITVEDLRRLISLAQARDAA